jgi:hypothetical protein
MNQENINKNNQQDFTNISTPYPPPPPFVHQPAQRSVPTQARLGLNKSYLKSVAGILRLSLIVCIHFY